MAKKRIIKKKAKLSNSKIKNKACINKRERKIYNEKLANVRTNYDDLLSNTGSEKDLFSSLIKENHLLVSKMDSYQLSNSFVSQLSEHNYMLESKNNVLESEIQNKDIELEKIKNTISYMVGNALVCKKKNKDTVFGVLKKLFKIRKIARRRRLGEKYNPVIQREKSKITTKELYPIGLDNLDLGRKILNHLPEDYDVTISKNAIWNTYSIGVSTLLLRYKFKKTEDIAYKNLLLRVKYFNVNNIEIQGVPKGLHLSATVGNYCYLDCDVDASEMRAQLSPPNGAVYALIGLQTWESKNSIILKNKVECIEVDKDKDTGAKVDIYIEEFNELADGVSIIVPCYKGIDTIGLMLNSISKQNLKDSLIELIVVVNGEEVGASALVKKFSVNNKNIAVKIFHSDIASASHARNLGLHHASRKYSVFLDNDDELSESYLSSLYEIRDIQSIAFTGIHDIDENGDVNEKNNIQNQYVNASKKSFVSYHDVTSLTTMIACKLMPTHLLKKIKFAAELRSGEDVVYFTEYISKFQPKVRLVNPSKNALYIRRITSSSVSRQGKSFDFYVIQRLDVIKRLDSIIEDGELTGEQEKFVRSKINAQTNFIKNYLDECPKDHSKFIELLSRLKIKGFPFNIVNKGKAKQLVISYCFPPFVDTSACVMAKRLRDKGQIVDVIHNNMSKVRDKSEDLNLLVEDLIENRKELNTPTTFANWQGIESFADQAADFLDKSDANYESLYSRAMWPASHFAGFVCKMKKPTLKWVAEFSDPLMYDIESKERYAEISDEFIDTYLRKSSGKHNKFLSEYIGKRNMYFWCEFLPYIFADELIFTCENQRTYMIGRLNNKKLAELVLTKSVISHHPTLDKKYYTLSNVVYPLNKNKKNIGYFGAFYSKRNLDDVVKALKIYQESKSTQQIMLHVFTGQKAEAEKFVDEMNLNKLIRINSYLSYLDFLSAIREFDCLIVNDSSVSNEKSINPYLPSKVSDYLGASTDIWSIVEKGSALSMMEGIKYTSNCGDVSGALRILKNIGICSIK